VRAQVRSFEYVNLIAKSRDEYRDVMIEGESGIMAVCPPYERPTYRKSLRRLDWPNGAQTLCFTAEEPEQLRGPQHQRLWGDEFAKWPYLRETWDQAVLGLRLPPDPRALLTSTPKPVPVLRELVEEHNAGGPIVITKGTTYENRANLAPEFFNELIGRYEGTRLGRQELDAELLLDEGLAYRLTDGVHVIPAETPVDNWWTRFEAMDYGTTAPTSWGCFATDYDQNVVAFGLYHSPGYPSEHAAEIHRLRERWWSRNDRGELERSVCFAPPDIKTRWGKRDVTGRELSAETEFADHGITFATAQTDRRAGYLRVAEALKCDPARPFPDWHPKARELGAPRFYVLDTEEMQPLIEAIRDAPLEDPESPLSKLPGEAVEQDWESRLGHAHAMLRYALTSRPAASAEPQPTIEDPRAARVAERLQRLADAEKADLVDV
jgi:hypothetical protein